MFNPEEESLRNIVRFGEGFRIEWREVLCELWQMVKLGTPLCIAYLINYAPVLTFMGYAGRLGVTELDATGLGLSYIFVVCMSVSGGIGTAIQGQFAQAWGAGAKEKLKDAFHRALFISTIVFFLVTFPLMLNSEAILILFKQEPDISHMAGICLIIFLFAAYMFYLYEVISRFLYAQEILIPIIVSAVVILVLAILELVACIIFELSIYWAVSLGSAGFFFLVAITLALMTIYPELREMHLLTVSPNMLRKWLKICKLIVPAVIQLEAIWVLNQIATIFAGILGSTELGAQSVILRYTSFFYFVVTGYSSICITRIAQHVGANNVQAAKTAFLTTFLLHLFIASVVAILVLALRYPLAQLGSNDQSVIDLTASVTPLVGVGYFSYFIETAAMTHLRAVGKLIFPAIITFVVYYIFTIPIGAVLAFSTSMGLIGYYVAQSLGQIVVAASTLLYAMAIDVKAVSQKLGTDPTIKNTTKTPNEAKEEESPLVDGALGARYDSEQNDEEQKAKVTETNSSESNTSASTTEGAVGATATGKKDKQKEEDKRSWKKLILQKLPVFIITVAVVIVSILLRCLQPLYLQVAQNITLPLSGSFNNSQNNLPPY